MLKHVKLFLELDKQLAEKEEQQKREIANIKSREEAETLKVAEEERLKSETARIATEEKLQSCRRKYATSSNCCCKEQRTYRCC